MSGDDKKKKGKIYFTGLENIVRRQRELEEKQKAEAKAQEEAKQREEEQKQRENEQKQRENEQKQRITQQQQQQRQQQLRQQQLTQQQLRQQQANIQASLSLPRISSQAPNTGIQATGSQGTALFGPLGRSWTTDEINRQLTGIVMAQQQARGTGTILPQQQQQQSSAMGFGGMAGNLGLNLTSNIIGSQTQPISFPQTRGYQAPIQPSNQFNTQFQNPFQTGTFGSSFGRTLPQYSYPSNFQNFQRPYQQQQQQYPSTTYAQDTKPYYSGFPGDPHANRPSTALPPPIPQRPEDIKDSSLDDSKADTMRRGIPPYNENIPRVYTGATGQKYVAKKERQQYEQKSKQQKGYRYDTDIKDDSKQPRQPGRQGPSGSGGAGGPSEPGRGGPGGPGGGPGTGGPGGGGPGGDPGDDRQGQQGQRRKKPIDPRQEVKESNIIFTPDQDVVLDNVPKPPYFSISLSIISVGKRHNQRAVGHIALMDYFGKTHLNVYVKPDKPVVSFFGPNTGLRLDRIENEWIPLNEAREILIQRLPKNACLVGHFISDTISWLDIKQGTHFREAFDVNTIWKAWSSSLRGFLLFPLLHQAQCVLNLPAYQFYPSATNKARLISRLLQTYIHNKEFNPFLIQHYKHNLRSIEPIPSFEISYPYFEGVCQGVKKYCRCGADVVPYQPQFRYYRGYFKPWVPKQSYIPYGRRIRRAVTFTDDVIRQKLLRLLGPEYENYRGSLQLTDIKEDIREDQFEDSKDDSKDDTKEDIKAADDDDDDDEDEQKRIIETKTETKGADDTKADE